MAKGLTMQDDVFGAKNMSEFTSLISELKNQVRVNTLHDLNNQYTIGLAFDSIGI